MPALTQQEEAMLASGESAAVQKAMELLVRYADSLRAERFVEPNNVAGVPGGWVVIWKGGGLSPEASCRRPGRYA